MLDLRPLIAEPAEPRSLPEGRLAVEFDNVRFSYPAASDLSLASLEEVATLDTRGGQEVLHGVSFTARPGQLIALVGPSGAGKSTLAALTTRLYDVDSGSLRVSGVDLRELSFESIRRSIGMVTQDGHLWHDTLGPIIASPARRPRTSSRRTRCAAAGSSS